MKTIFTVIFLCVFQWVFTQDCLDKRPKFDINDFTDDSSKLMVGDVCVLDVLFAFSGGCRFYPEFEDTVAKIVTFMEKHPKIKVEISAHSDARGSRESNLKLTECRAMRIAEYVAYKGISKDRFVVVGKGEDEPLCSEEIFNATPSEDDREKRHKTNRRVEVKIISVN